MKFKIKNFGFLIVLLFLSLSAPLLSRAEERSTGKEELKAVKAGKQAAFQWENNGSYWKLLYLDTKNAAWKYARRQWVQIGDRYYYFLDDGKLAEGWFQDPAKKESWYFAECDSAKHDNPNAGRVLTGWAMIPDSTGVTQHFYFGASAKGRPSGMYQGEGEYYKSYEIDGKKYSFDAAGHCSSKEYPSGIESFALKRV